MLNINEEIIKHKIPIKICSETQTVENAVRFQSHVSDYRYMTKAKFVLNIPIEKL